MDKISYAWYMRKSLAICSRPAIDVANDKDSSGLRKICHALGSRDGIEALRKEIIDAFNAERAKTNDSQM